MEKSLFYKIKKNLLHPLMIVEKIVLRTSKFWSDKLYVSIMYRIKFGKSLNLEDPQTYNEKLNWMKLYFRNPLFTTLVDKVKAKEWAAERIGWQHIIPTIGVWENPDDIDFDALPEKFVLKCNHNSGLGMCICRDKKNLDIQKVKNELKKGLRQDYFLTAREWPYKNVPRRILAEKFMTDGDSSDLTDYKFFCFDGEPFIMYVSKDNATNATTDFFDMDYNRLPIRMKDPNSDNPPAKPELFEEMKSYARILSKGIPHVRVDFYVINKCIYFGEMTFFHNAGWTKIYPEEWSHILGKLIKLPKSGNFH